MNEKEYKNGDVLHCTRQSLISKIIRFVTRSTLSHTALFITIHGEPFIIESQADGTRLKTLEEWERKFSYSVIITRPKKNDEAILLKSVKPFLNSKYGYIDLIRHFILSKFGVWLGSRREDKNLVCSEFVMRVYGNPYAYKATPQAAFDWCIYKGFELIEL